MCSGEIEYLTIDSGACDSVAHPASFPNTDNIKNNELGKVYGACGGEAVNNIGTKRSTLLTKEGKLSIRFSKLEINLQRIFLL